jgi:hypothetical protein
MKMADGMKILLCKNYLQCQGFACCGIKAAGGAIERIQIARSGFH